MASFVLGSSSLLHLTTCTTYYSHIFHLWEEKKKNRKDICIALKIWCYNNPHFSFEHSGGGALRRRERFIFALSFGNGSAKTINHSLECRRARTYLQSLCVHFKRIYQAERGKNGKKICLIFFE